MTTNHMRLAILSLTLALALSSAATAQDEPWPTHPVRLIAASGPGGNPDVLARLLAEKFSNAFGKPFIVENVPGAGGVVAANLVAKSPPDGHVLMFGDSGALAINPALNPGLGYDPVKDFAPVMLIGSSPFMLLAAPTFEAGSVRELVAMAKGRNHIGTIAGKLNGAIAAQTPSGWRTT